MKKILITGAAGYIGSQLARILIQKNYDLTLIDNYSTHSNIKEINGVAIQHQDIRDKIDISEYDTIFHLAAISGIKTCEEDKEEAFDVNVRGTFNLLKTCKGRFIFPSTSAVYGQAELPEIDEQHSTIPRSHYGVTKLEGERLVTLHDNYCILRFSNVYGMGLFCKRTVADCFVETALKKETLTIHGDGRQRRDFVHINDVVRSYILAMKLDTNATYNIGGNEALSINDIAELVIKNNRQVFGYTLDKKYIPIDCGMVWKDFIYSSRLAKDGLGYEPAYSISDEIRERLNAYCKKLGGKT